MDSVILSGGPWLAIQRVIVGGAARSHEEGKVTIEEDSTHSSQPLRMEWVVTEEPTAELGEEEDPWSCVNPISSGSSFEAVDFGSGLHASYKAALLARLPGQLVLAPGGATRGRGGRFGPGSWPRRRSPRNGVLSSSSSGK